MKIATIGRGNIGGGLGRRWRGAGHDVTELGKEGGDVSDAEVVLVAVPGGSIADALAKVSGLEGKVAIDATNHFQGERPPFDSLAHQVKSITGGPVAKSFNLNFCPGLRRDRRATCSPEQPLLRRRRGPRGHGAVDSRCGFEPANAGGLKNARLLEDNLKLLMTLDGPVFYRYWKPGEH